MNKMTKLWDYLDEMCYFCDEYFRNKASNFKNF